MKRFIVSLFLILATVVPCSGQGKPNTLTPKEIADGWILLFDGETTFGWNHDGEVSVADGSLVLSGEKSSAFHGTGWGSFELKFDYRLDNRKNKGSGNLGMKSGAGGQLAGEKGKWQGSRVYYDFDPKTNRFVFQNRDAIELPDIAAEGYGRVAQKRLGNSPTDHFGFLTFREAKLEVRNIKLLPLAKITFAPKAEDYRPHTFPMASLFNGKDLAGWNVFPGKKSKFAVIDSAINVKDGPGDLQTAGKYKDFVLQLEAISNGKHLNSGIFFRCRDGEYQNGYEAQIHNGFAETPKKYLLEEYDPNTNKLIGKKEAMYNASDFGTGAIYRRVPARKQMSKDGEWFGMTVVAQGNRFATWVNGIQVTDWTDNRPKSDNARTGCRLEGGHLSIQGHDPTTDLSFRNFRIAEYK